MDDSLYRMIDITIKAVTLVFGSGILFLLGRFVVNWWRGRLRVDIKAYEVITEPAKLLPAIYNEENNPDVLADHRIPYQHRDPKHDLQDELRAVLHHSRYLLITAPTGYGKTREAAVLSTSLMNEEWRVIRIKSGWLDVPKEFLPELKNDRRRVLILLDDLNGLFRTGGFMQSPKAEQMPIVAQSSYHDRLRDTLDAFEKMCGLDEIRVIATARDEADEWKVLEYNPRDVLWKRFERVELPAPHESAVVKMLEEATTRAQLSAEHSEFLAIARENDGTLANIALNLRKVQKEGKTLSLANYTESLDGSWREVYARAVGKHPAVRYIYDAIDVLRQLQFPVQTFYVESMASLLWGGGIFQDRLHQFQIKRALKFR